LTLAVEMVSNPDGELICAALQAIMTLNGEEARAEAHQNNLILQESFVCLYQLRFLQLFFQKAHKSWKIWEKFILTTKIVSKHPRRKIQKFRAACLTRSDFVVHLQ